MDTIVAIEAMIAIIVNMVKNLFKIGFFFRERNRIGLQKRADISFFVCRTTHKQVVFYIIYFTLKEWENAFYSKWKDRLGPHVVDIRVHGRLRSLHSQGRNPKWAMDHES